MLSQGQDESAVQTLTLERKMLETQYQVWVFTTDLGWWMQVFVRSIDEAKVAVEKVKEGILESRIVVVSVVK